MKYRYNKLGVFIKPYRQAKFKGKNCPFCGMKCWHCFNCGHLITAASSTTDSKCLSCGAASQFLQLNYCKPETTTIGIKPMMPVELTGGLDRSAYRFHLPDKTRRESGNAHSYKKSTS